MRRGKTKGRKGKDSKGQDGAGGGKGLVLNGY